MTDKEIGAGKKYDLRNQAEDTVKDKVGMSPEDVEAMSPGEIRQALLELHVQETMLRIQNEELLHAQEALSLSEKKFRTLYDSASDAVMLLDENGFFDCNQATLSIFGCATQEEFCSKHPADLSPPQQPCGTDSLALSSQMIKQAMENGSNHFDWVHKRIDTGEYFPAEVLLSSMELSGKLVVQAVVRDITIRKHAEDELWQNQQRFQGLVETLYDWIWEVDPHGRYTYISPRIKDILGYEPEELIGKTPFDLMPKEEAKRVMEIFGSLVAEHKPIINLENINLHKDGRPLVMETSGLPFYDNKGNFKGYRGTDSDATERKQTEDALRENEIKLQAIFDTVGTGIIIVDKDTQVIIEANLAALEMTGLTKESVIGHICHSLVCPAQAGKCPVKDLGQNVDHSERKLVCAEGNQKDILKTVHPITLKGRECYIESFIDISDRLQAEDGLRESEEKHHLLVQNISETMLVIQDGVIKYVNLQAVASFGYTEQEVLSINIFDLIHPDDRDLITQRYLQKINGDAAPTKHIYRTLHKSGQIKWVELSSVLIDWEGRPATLNLISDITERKRSEDELRSSEERYRTIIETIPDAYFEADLAGNIIFCNNQFAASSGYTKEELQGFNFQILFDGQNAESAYRAFNEVYKTGKPSMHNQLEWLNKAGERKVLESSINLIRDLQGKTIGFRAVARDVTEKLRHEVLSLHSQKLESVGQLAAGIAHEINTPIQFIGDNIGFMKGAFQDILSMITMLDVLQDIDSPDLLSDRDLIDRIHKKGEEIDLAYLKKEIPKAIGQSLDGLQRVSKIVQAMREFSHPGGEDMSSLDINKAIESTITLTRNEWKYSADLIATLAPDLPIVQGYPADFNQVILNLIVNAAQALQEKIGKDGDAKGRIEVFTRQDGNEVEICIRDTGPGIPPEAQSRIFDPFFTTKEVGKGTGQGLTIVQNIIVKKHGGKIFFETKPGEGTAFFIRLPLDNLNNVSG